MHKPSNHVCQNLQDPDTKAVHQPRFDSAPRCPQSNKSDLCAGEMAAMQARNSGFNPDRDYSASNVSKGQLMDENVSQMYHA
jgi:hypothetical protein